MKIVKVGYMNDEQKDIMVRTLDLRYDCVAGTGDSYVTLQSCEYREFEVHIPDDTIVYLKKWPNMVMLSYHAQTAPQQGDQLPESPRCEADE